MPEAFLYTLRCNPLRIYPPILSYVGCFFSGFVSSQVLRSEEIKKLYEVLSNNYFFFFFFSGPLD